MPKKGLNLKPDLPGFMRQSSVGNHHQSPDTPPRSRSIGICSYADDSVSTINNGEGEEDDEEYLHSLFRGLLAQLDVWRESLVLTQPRGKCTPQEDEPADQARRRSRAQERMFIAALMGSNQSIMSTCPRALILYVAYCNEASARRSIRVAVQSQCNHEFHHPAAFV